MGVAGGMKPERCPLDLIVDPCLVPLRAGGDDGRKGLVARHRESAGLQPAREGARQVELLQGENGAAARLDPEDVVCFPAVGHREDPRRITAKQEAGIKPAHAPTVVCQSR